MNPYSTTFESNILNLSSCIADYWQSQMLRPNSPTYTIPLSMYCFVMEKYIHFSAKLYGRAVIYQRKTEVAVVA